MRIVSLAATGLMTLSACAGSSGRVDDERSAPSLTATEPEPDPALDDRVTLATLSALLGAPLPAPGADDPVGVEEVGLYEQRVFVPFGPLLGGEPTRLRASAFKQRTYRLELTFPRSCPDDCAAQLQRALDGWLGPMNETVQGRARIFTRQHDTVRARYEVFPGRPDLTRLVLACQPLADVAAGRPSRLPAVGQPAEVDARPACRELPP